MVETIGFYPIDHLKYCLAVKEGHLGKQSFKCNLKFIVEILCLKNIVHMHESILLRLMPVFLLNQKSFLFKGEKIQCLLLYLP